MAESLVNILLPKLTSFINDAVQLREEVMYVKEEMERIRAFLRVADYLEETDEEVRVWVKQIQDIAFDTEDALDEFRLLLGHDHEGPSGLSGLLQRISCCVRNLKARYRIVANIQQISLRVRSVCEGHQRLRDKLILTEQGWSLDRNRERNWQDPRGNALLLDETDLVGIEEPKKQLVEWLVEGSHDMEVVSVVGMGGLGKTTLVKQVFEDPIVKKQFAVSAWITLSRSFNFEVILKELLLQIMRVIEKPLPPGADTNTMSSHWLKMTVREMLRTRSYLIVLDDVWCVREWHTIKYVLPNSVYGSRVMITTRNAELASTAQKESRGKAFHMKPLTVEQSWKLFCRKTFQRKSCPSHLEQICKNILRRCEGLPLAIVDISGVLATKDESRINDWDVVCRSIGAEIDGNDRLEDLKKVLLLSFTDLPYYLKSCFLLLSVFPDGCEIRHKRLIRLWIAEGFVERKEGKMLEEVAEDYFNELLSRSLLQVVKTTSDGRVKTCRIHNFLWEIVVSKSMDQSFATRVGHQRDAWPERARRLSIHNTDMAQVIQQNKSFPQLRSLYMFDEERPFPIGVLSDQVKLLRVLDFEGAPPAIFPAQIVDCRCLTYLSLRGSKVKAIPSLIGKLRNLQTLDLKHTSVSSLPTEILKLQKLRHLLVYRYEHSRDMRYFKHGFKGLSGIGALKSLQKLCFIEAECEGNNSTVKELRGLTQLRRLGILKLRKEDGKDLCSAIENLSNLQALSLTSVNNDESLDVNHLASPPNLLQRVYLNGKLEALPGWIGSLHHLAMLHLRWSKFKNDPLVSLQSLPNLLQLELVGVYSGTKLRFNAKGFTKLRSLGIINFDPLRCIEFDGGAMPVLEKLFIERCNLLEKLPSGIEFLTKLKVLAFIDMSDVFTENLLKDEEEEDRKKFAHVPEVHYGFWKDGYLDLHSVRR